MEFAKVTDIAIPEGNVIKIHETGTGRVLWEKKRPMYNTTTKLDILKGLTLEELKTVPGFTYSAQLGSNYPQAPFPTTSLSEKVGSTTFWIYRIAEAYDQKQRANEFRTDWFESSVRRSNDKAELKSDYIRAKWFVNTSELPPDLELRYYEEGKSGEMGDNLSYAWLIKKSYYTMPDTSYWQSPLVTVNGTRQNIYWWLKVKIVTALGYDEKYIPFLLLGDMHSESGMASTRARAYETCFYQNATIAADISESNKLP